MIGAFRGDAIINPVLFELGSWKIYWYGLAIVVGFLLGFWFILREVSKKDHETDMIVNMVLGAVIVGLIGARLVHVILSWDMYQGDLSQALYFWQGGLNTTSPGFNWVNA